MQVFRTASRLKQWRDRRGANLRVGFVPTMGFLHEGHLDLFRKAKRENDIVVGSIFVNPLQFSANEDLSKYPRDERRDLKNLQELGVDLIFAPKSSEELYPVGRELTITSASQLFHILEAKFRPGHFEGVSTVVLKLFELVAPHSAYFGEKDYQQLQVIKHLVEALFLPVKIHSVKTRREKTGLAMSSRNSYFSAEDRKAAANFYQTLKTSKDPESAKRALKKFGFTIDYVEIWKEDLSAPAKRGRWLAAVRYKGVRLIDNLKRN